MKIILYVVDGVTHNPEKAEKTEKTKIQKKQNPKSSRVPTNNQQTRTTQKYIMNAPSSSKIISSNSNNNQRSGISPNAPLPAVLQRCLGDRSYEKRKNAALEIEALVKSLQEANDSNMIRSIITVLSKDFCLSMNANYRKGGLIGIAATAIGLHTTQEYLELLLPSVLQCFDDPESRVRYYACESLYNIAKVTRVAILAQFFHPIFEGLCKLYADPDVDVKNGATLFDRLMKDIVTESSPKTFSVNQFIPLLQIYIKRTNPYIRQLLVGWIIVLNSVPDISMIDYLPEFLDGLFNMLSDSNREIRQAADSALSEFLREVHLSSVVEFGPILSILVDHCQSKNRLNRLTAVSWMKELINHPHSGKDALLPFYAQILEPILKCIYDSEAEIRQVAQTANRNLFDLLKDTKKNFEIRPLLNIFIKELFDRNDVSTQIAALHWINMLLEKHPISMNDFLESLLPVLLRTLSDPSDEVVLLNLEVLSRIALGNSTDDTKSNSNLKLDPTIHDGIMAGKSNSSKFQMVLNAILTLFSKDRALLELRGSLIIRKLCVLLNAENVYTTLAQALVSYESSFSPSNKPPNERKGDEQIMDSPVLTSSDEHNSSISIDFISTMVQTLNLILLSAAELHGLRTILGNTFKPEKQAKNSSSNNQTKQDVFPKLFHCWCHNPVSTFSLCLLARAYDIAYALIRKFSELDVSVGFLLQVDKLVQLLESPIFLHLRLSLLDVESPHHKNLLKSCYGLLMILPQSDAFRSLNDRLTTVCNLRDNLGIHPSPQDDALPSILAAGSGNNSNIQGGDSFNSVLATMEGRKMEHNLLQRFDEVMILQSKVKRRKGGGKLQETHSDNIKRDKITQSSIANRDRIVNASNQINVTSTGNNTKDIPNASHTRGEKQQENTAEQTHSPQQQQVTSVNNTGRTMRMHLSRKEKQIENNMDRSSDQPSMVGGSSDKVSVDYPKNNTGNNYASRQIPADNNNPSSSTRGDSTMMSSTSTSNHIGSASSNNRHRYYRPHQHKNSQSSNTNNSSYTRRVDTDQTNSSRNNKASDKILPEERNTEQHSKTRTGNYRRDSKSYNRHS